MAEPGKDTTTCGRCGAALPPGAEYAHRGETLCQDCCLAARQTRPRKTHWQYLGAIKTDYLREPGEG